MDNLDDSENNAKVSDSAYSNSCSNSQSRRSHSSKSTHSGSHSSGSSGYGGKQSTSGSSKTLSSQQPEKRTKDKEGKKKKQQGQTELVQIPDDVEFRLPDPAPVTEVEEELEDASPPPATEQVQKAVQRSSESIKEDITEKPDVCNTLQPAMHILTSKPVYSEGFSCVISMHDGVVLYMSSTLTATLDFPKDMWIGRSFIDFVHPLDHNTFASQITDGLAVPKEANGMQNAGNAVSTMFCRIRRYRSLATGFSVKDRSVTFTPFLLKLSFKKVYEEKGSVIYLVIQATQLSSVYNTPNEVIEDAVPFVMRHVANGNVEYIDNEAVPLLGYLPQDVTGQDVLKLYHPEDLPYVRHVYETIVKQGRAPRSKPYRMLAQNGHYLKLETEWSSFINPWSRKLEFVIGKHYVTEGPANPDVFEAPPSPIKVSEDDNVEIEGLKDSIVRILNEVPTRPAELVKQQMTKRCQDLASFMESLIENQPKVEDELRLEIQENDNSYFERDSVMLGGISPHHDYNDSKSSTGTPLSYNKLNYNINLKRYFDSHQDGFDEDGVTVTEGTLVPIKGQYSGECMSPMAQYSADSVDITSVESACLTYEDSPVALPHEYQPIRLTESILNKHNNEMEKKFVKTHRESRPANKEEREKLSNESKQKKRDHLVRCNASFVPTTVNSVVADQPHGLKRASKPQEAEASTHKQHCASSRQMRRRQPSSSAPAPPSASVATVSTSASMWPQNFMNGMNTFMPQQMPLVSPITAVPGFMPMYYLPTTPSTMPCTSAMSAHDPTKTSSQMQFQAPAVQYMMYGQAVFGSPIVMSPINHQAPFAVQQNVIRNQFSNPQHNLTLATRNYEEACKPGLPLKPLGKSQLAAWREEKRAAATAPSPPASSRSINTSICSATNALNRSNEAVPESSASRDSKMKSEEAVDRTDGESNYSSFYSSFFKTESGSAEDSGDAKNKQNNANSSGASTAIGKDSPRNKQMQRRKKELPWMEQVCVTSELIYKYQVLTKSLDEVLISDKKKLVTLEQPSLVDEQLGQLYMDLQLEGVAARLTLEEGITSSGSSSEEGHRLSLDALAKRARRKRKYNKLVMIYEEDAPLPSPEEEPEPEPSTSVA
ncbi:period circadian protein isoform X2 [Leguminivora glycinivorella]|uniref:period circadian protein isoform X2 n=1 Tax=Leguminivora glycinivorella TaxID=1035111 RepID=UPI00200EF043|nr:period circadian protein isoform X2 [Leguminivora glycinivorella]